jgi:hypothetical protein
MDEFFVSWGYYTKMYPSQIQGEKKVSSSP